MSTCDVPHETEVVVRGSGLGFAQEITARSHRLVADEPISSGGSDTGPTPYDFLLAALGSCASMTVGLYARRKTWPLEQVTVRLRHSRIHAADCAECETKAGRLDRVEWTLQFSGALTGDATGQTVGDRPDVSCASHTTVRDSHPRTGSR